MTETQNDDLSLSEEKTEEAPIKAGRIAEISEEDVFAAIEAVIEEGKRLSSYAVKMKLGNVGNNQRYRKLIAKYKANRQVTQAEPVQDLPLELQEQFNALSQGLNEQLHQLVKALNNRATTTAEQRVAAAIKGAREEVEEIAAELQEADAFNADLESKAQEYKDSLNETKGLIEQLQAEKTTALTELAKLRQQNAVQEERLTALQAISAENKALQDDNARLMQQLTSVQADIHRAQERAAKIQDKSDEYEKERDDYMARALGAESKANQATYRLEQVTKEFDKLTVALEEKAAEMAAHSEKLSILSTDLSTSRGEIASLEKLLQREQDAKNMLMAENAILKSKQKGKSTESSHPKT